MKKLIIATVLSVIAAVSGFATTMTFVGVVDSSNRFVRGMPFVATFVFSPVNGQVSNYSIMIGGQYLLNGTVRGGQVVYDNNPADGSVFYQVVNSDWIAIEMQAATLGGVIPPVSQFNLNDFLITACANDPGTTGHFTDLPVIK